MIPIKTMSSKQTDIVLVQIAYLIPYTYIYKERGINLDITVLHTIDALRGAKVGGGGGGA